jgi:hypothetical protein
MVAQDYNGVEDVIVDAMTSKIYVVEKRPSESAFAGIGTLMQDRDGFSR